MRGVLGYRAVLTTGALTRDRRTPNVLAAKDAESWAMKLSVHFGCIETSTPRPTLLVPHPRIGELRR